MEPTINLFTTTKGFDTVENIHQINAFNSWKLLDNVNILVFCEDEYMIPFFSEYYGFSVITDFEKDEFDMPLMSSIYQIAHQKCPEDEFYGYVNSDIILLPEFIDTYNNIHSKVSNFMMIGQRWDWDTKKVRKVEIETTNWDSIITNECKLHNPGGLDYFIHNREFINVNEIPPFTVAMGRWDHWFAGYGLKKSEHPVIDTTLTNNIIHQDPGERLSGEFIDPPDGYNKRTYQILRNNYYFYRAKLHGQCKATPFYTDGTEIKIRENTESNEFGENFGTDQQIN